MEVYKKERAAELEQIGKLGKPLIEIIQKKLNSNDIILISKNTIKVFKCDALVDFSEYYSVPCRDIKNSSKTEHFPLDLK